MGYTHYWTPKKGWAENIWDRLTHDAQVIIERSGVEIAGPCGDGVPELTKDVISLNGKGEEDSHETFRLTQSCCAFVFCKTDRKPYDVVVGTILLRAKHLSPEKFRLTSNGRVEGCEWKRASELYQKVFGEAPDMNCLNERDENERKKVTGYIFDEDGMHFVYDE